MIIECKSYSNILESKMLYSVLKNDKSLKIRHLLKSSFQSECIVAYLGLLISVLTDLTGQNVSVNMPNDVSFAARASSSRVSVFTFVEGQAFLICYLGASSASIGHPRTPTHITSGNVARTGGKQLRRLLKNSRIQSKCIEHLSLMTQSSI